MFNTVTEIQEQIQAGEDSLAEFKELRFRGGKITDPRKEDVAAELVAFSNSEGGGLFLGVSDHGVVQGIPVERLKDVEAWLVNLASTNCDPPIRPVVRKVVLPSPSGEDAHVIVATVPRSLYVHQTSRGRWYIRVGSQKRILSGAELSRLFQERGRSFVFDETVVPRSSLEDLESPLLQRFFGTPDALSWEELLVNTRVVARDEEGMNRPTVAGLLAFGGDPQRHLHSALINAAVYRGEAADSDHLIHAESVTGKVQDQIEGAVAFVNRFMIRPARKKMGRLDTPQYELAAVQEAIVNSVVHRDYSISGSKIRLYLFDDRLELSSPGSLPNTLTLETLPYRQFTRNQLLVSFLSKMRSELTGEAFIEARGEGVRRILKLSKEYSGLEPLYELFGSELRLTIWAKPSPHAG